MIEVMVTIAIMVILVSAGIPSMSAWVQSNQKDSRSSSLAGLLRAARVEALTRNNSVTVATAAGGGNWASAITMYMDTNGPNDPYDINDGDILIREIDLTTTTVTIDSNATANSYISFDGNGRLDEGGQTVEIAICQDYETEGGQTIEINIVGRVSISESTDDCTP